MSAHDGLEYLATDPKFIFFTDFDGTITLQDSNDYLTDKLGYGQAQRLEDIKDVLADRVTFRDAFHAMMDSVTKPFPECIQFLVENVKLDPGFKAFLSWAGENNVPIVVLSGGMEPVIRALLKSLVGEKESHSIFIVSNNVGPKPGKTIDQEDGWEITFHDESGFGHDKSRAIRPYSTLPAPRRPTLFYAGDGVSDLSAARETDLLFAKKGHDLVRYCVQEDIPFTVFETWSDILQKTKQIVDGKISVATAAREGYETFKTQTS